MNNKAVSYLPIILGVVAVIAAILIVFFGFGNAIEQFPDQSDFITVVSDTLILYIIAAIVLVVGAVFVFLGITK